MKGNLEFLTLKSILYTRILLYFNAQNIFRVTFLFFLNLALEKTSKFQIFRNATFQIMRIFLFSGPFY